MIFRSLSSGHRLLDCFLPKILVVVPQCIISVNVSASATMIGACSTPTLEIGGREIEVYKTLQYLGVMMDQELTWKEQEKAVVERAFKRMAKPGKEVGPKIQKRIYKSILIPEIISAVKPSNFELFSSNYVHSTHIYSHPPATSTKMAQPWLQLAMQSFTSANQPQYATDESAFYGPCTRPLYEISALWSPRSRWSCSFSSAR